MPKNEVNSRQIKLRAVLGKHIGLLEIEGAHIKPGAITGSNLAPSAVDSIHIAPKSVTDAHLAIDWAQKGSEVLQSKLVVDYVQTAPVLVSADTSIVTSVVTSPVATSATEKGVIVDPPNNHVIIRAGHDTTQPLHDEDGEEIKARITHDGTDYVLGFFTNKSGIETIYTFPQETSILFQYPQRFDLESVSEMFGANEKFVDYSVDVSTRFHIKQLVADIFGSGYILGSDGMPTEVEPINKNIIQNTLDIEVLEQDLIDLVDGLELTDGQVKTLMFRLDAIDGDSGSIGTLFRQLNALDLIVTEHKSEIDSLVEQGGEFVDRISTLEQNPARMRRIDKKFVQDEITPDLSYYGFDLTPEELPALGDLDVYYNGALLMKDVHYTESIFEETKASGIQFVSRLILVDDILQVRWVV